jgi:hypothetical protein
MVGEMRFARTDADAARVAALRPRLTLTMEHPTASTGRFVLMSCGAAAAFNVRITIDYGPGVVAAVPFFAPIMTTGTTQVFLAPDREIEMAKLASLYREVRVVGTFQDVERTPYNIDETFELRHYWESNTAAGWHHAPKMFTRLTRAVEKMVGVTSPVEP